MLPINKQVTWCLLDPFLFFANFTLSNRKLCLAMVNTIAVRTMIFVPLEWENFLPSSFDYPLQTVSTTWDFCHEVWVTYSTSSGSKRDSLTKVLFWSGCPEWEHKLNSKSRCQYWVMVITALSCGNVVHWCLRFAYLTMLKTPYLYFWLHKFSNEARRQVLHRKNFITSQKMMKVILKGTPWVFTDR